jgi:hypothetical protein
MEQSLELPPRTGIVASGQFRTLRNNAGKKMMLIGETIDSKLALLRVPG